MFCCTHAYASSIICLGSLLPMTHLTVAIVRHPSGLNVDWPALWVHRHAVPGTQTVRWRCLAGSRWTFPGEGGRQSKGAVVFPFQSTGRHSGIQTQSRDLRSSIFAVLHPVQKSVSNSQYIVDSPVTRSKSQQLQNQVKNKKKTKTKTHNRYGSDFAVG